MTVLGMSKTSFSLYKPRVAWSFYSLVKSGFLILSVCFFYFLLCLFFTFSRDFWQYLVFFLDLNDQEVSKI